MDIILANTQTKKMSTTLSNKFVLVALLFCCFTLSLAADAAEKTDEKSKKLKDAETTGSSAEKVKKDDDEKAKKKKDDEEKGECKDLAKNCRENLFRCKLPSSDSNKASTRETERYETMLKRCKKSCLQCDTNEQSACVDRSKKCAKQWAEKFCTSQTYSRETKCYWCGNTCTAHEIDCNCNTNEAATEEGKKK